jgi:hypothetical protein
LRAWREAFLSVLDGEAVAHCVEGLPDFNALLGRSGVVETAVRPELRTGLGGRVHEATGAFVLNDIAD